jgi:DNA repair protein RecN (Recombination protein N)
LSADGRGRAFIEDEPAPVRTLARLGERLLAIQGQNSEQELADRHAAVDLLDAFAGADGLRLATADSARAWGAAREALESLEQSRRGRVALDTIRLQIQEIEEAAPDAERKRSLPSGTACSTRTESGAPVRPPSRLCRKGRARRRIGSGNGPRFRARLDRSTRTGGGSRPEELKAYGSSCRSSLVRNRSRATRSG